MPGQRNMDLDSGTEEESDGGEVKLVGVFLHGGGYCSRSVRLFSLVILGRESSCSRSG